MSAVFQEVTLGWGGKSYTIKPTMELLNRIEQRVSLAGLASSLGSGAPKLSHVATAVAIMLQYAGVQVSDEDVYVELMQGDQQAITGMAQAVVIAAFPTRADSGNAKRPKATKRRT